MRDRIPTDPGRVKMTRSDGTFEYVTIERADNPTQEGTPLNKALLDYAVAACGVTAGTATALTLDDAFGGFTLVDGAKVNFRLHVASGANPTLNVNGTGAKAIVNAYGGAMPVSTPPGTWITANYSAELDSYIISAGKSPVITKKTLDSDVSAVSIPLSEDYKSFRLEFAATCTMGTNISISSDATVFVARTIGHQIISASNSTVTYYEGSGRTIAKSSYTGNMVNTTVYGNMLIANGDGNARVGGTLATRFTSDVFTAGLSGIVSTITIAGYFEKGSTFILEGMPE